jgi:Ca-activated chloride channel family protein
LFGAVQKTPVRLLMRSIRIRWATTLSWKGGIAAMAEFMGQESSGQPGRHRYRSRTGRTGVIVAVVVAIAAAAGLTWFVRSQQTGDAAAAGSPTTQQRSGATTSSGSRSADSVTAGGAAGSAGCAVPGGSLTVAAAPDIAGVITAVTRAAGPAATGGCAVSVTPVDPAQLVADGPSGVEVWIPDSSMWVQRAAAAGRAMSAQNPVIATSPVVFALSASTVAQLTAAGTTPNVEAILATRTTASPIRVGLPDPQRSATAVAAVLAARAAVTGTTDARAALTWAMRSSPADLPIGDGDLLARLSADPNTAVPVSERSVIAYNGGGGTPAATAIYPGAGAVALDYPVVTVSSDPAAVTAAGDLVGLLIGDTGKAALLSAGFRAPDGSAGPESTTASGMNPVVSVTSPLPALAAVDEAIRSVQISNEPSRMLAIMDISGSMQAQVEGAGGATRIDLAKQAASIGLGLYPATSEIGLWEFSTNLAPGSDHREVIPVSTLGPDQQGGTGAQRLAQAITGLQAIPDGGTGLYDTVLDAVRTMRANYDPARANSVLILTDGMNDDANGISLQTLLSTLAAEQDPSKVVPVIALAFGPDSDLDALTQISNATGGVTYESKDPRQIGEIFLDAVGQRLCRPSC